MLDAAAARRVGRRLLRRDGPAPRLRPAIAAMTVVRDEAAMLPRWIDYYGGQLGIDNLIVLDDNSTDGSTHGLDCTVHRIPGLPARNFNGGRNQLVSGIAQGLLASYDAVMFTDVDEFVVADPAHYEGLRDFVRSRRDTPVMAPLALNVVHHTSTEAPLRARRPVLGQRQFAKFAPLMCKPSLKRVPAAWCFSSHGIRTEYAVDPGLFMLHFKFADSGQLRAVAGRRQALVNTLGRGKASSWSRGPDELLALLEEVTAGVDLDTVPEFDPATVDLDALVHREGDRWRTQQEGQLQALRRQPLVRVPRRLHGLV